MHLISLSFPVATGTPAQRKEESFKKATKFVAELKLESELDIQQIREGVFGCVLPGDVEDAILETAQVHGAKILPFVENAAPEVKEGTWVTLKENAAGIQYRMTGTTASEPKEGNIKPGKYFVLGIEESNGGKYATLGRVDKLAEIGRSSGLGKYVYNVDLSILAGSIDTEVKTESVKAAKTESSAPRDRSLDVLDMLLENDPYVLAEAARNAKGGSDEDMSMDELLNISTGNTVEKASDTLQESVDGKQASDPLDEGMDPELFIESRAVVSALEEAGCDVDNMSDEEFDKAVDELLAKVEAEQGAEASGEDETKEEETVDASDETVSEPEGDSKDEAFEAVEAADETEKKED